MMKPEYDPWEEKYEHMRNEVAKNEAERIAAQLLGDGACLIEAQEGSGLTEEEFRKHPARFCLVELVNIHDNAVTFEPIHKVLCGTEAAAFFEEAAVFWQKEGDAVGRGKAIRLITTAG